MLFSLPTAACLGLGDDLVCLYNDNYKDLLGKRHPQIFGKPSSEGWSDIWDKTVEPSEQHLSLGYVVVPAY